MAQIQYVSLTNPNIKSILVDESGSALTVVSGGLYVVPQLTDESGNYTNMMSDTIFSGALVSLTTSHHEIHDGGSYMVSRTVDLGNASADAILVIVPNDATKKYHMLISYGSELESQFDLYEGATLSATTSATGTALVSYNRERNSSKTSSLGVYHSSVIATSGGDGTKIFEKHSGSGRQAGSELRTEEEIVLRNNTKYVLRVTNSTANNNYISWEINYYIHPGG